MWRSKAFVQISVNGSANEIVPAQPQGFPRKQQSNYGHKRAKKPRYVRLPTLLSAKHARVGGQASTLPSRNSQGKRARSRAVKRPDKQARKVSYRAENLYRAREFLGAKRDLITPSARSTTSTLQMPRLQATNIQDASNHADCKRKHSNAESFSK